MALASYYAEAHQRWTLKKQVMDDLKTKLLSPLRKQQHGWCSYFALAATLEPNLRVQQAVNVCLSILHLSKLGEIAKEKLPNQKQTAKRLLLILQEEGVFEEKQYEDILKGKLAEKDARRYIVTKFSTYRVDVPEDIKRALYQLRRGGPLLAVIRISANYMECYKSGLIYRFNPNRIVKRASKDLPETHVVAVVSFVLEGKVPCLECQDSRGLNFGRAGFLMVDITSVKEIYSIRIRLAKD